MTSFSSRVAGFGCAALAVLVLRASSAFAEDGPVVVPPVVQNDTGVPYPDGASGDAVVVLEVLVAKDGTVSDARVLEGTEPFAAQARGAVLAWHFAPATKGIVPVASRIQARVVFQEPRRDGAPVSATPPTPAASPPSAPAASTAPVEPSSQVANTPQPELEVTVSGRRRAEAGQTTLSAADIRQMPGAFGDPFRAIEALPGVVPVVSGLPFFYVRGAPPGNNGYYVDGVRVPLLFHIGIGQAVIHPALVERVDFFPGAAPARYGGFAGALVDGVTREPAAAPHGQVNLRLVDAGTLLESPFADGRGSALVAGRYGYPGPILRAITSEMSIDYWDYQARATWNVTERDTLGVFAFGSHDYLATEQRQDGVTKMAEQFVSDFHRVDLRYDHALSDGRIRVAATLGHDSQGAEPTYITNRSAALRLEADTRVADSVRLRGGANARLDDYGFEQHEPDLGAPLVPSSANPPPTNLTTGMYADVVWRAARRVEIVPGARADVYSSTRRTAPDETTRVTTTVPAVDPRLAVRVGLTPDVTWLSTVGLSHQYPVLRVGNLPASAVSASGFPSGNTRLQTAAQASQGIEVALPGDIALSATGFLSLWSGLTDLTANCFEFEPASFMAMVDPEAPPPVRPWICPSNEPVHGRAYGIEFLVRRSLSKRLGGLLSYTLSRSQREAHFRTLSGGDAVATVPSEGDRTHVLNAVLGYDLGRGWRAGGRFLFFTGEPYSKLSGSLPIPPYNGFRNPSFYRVDFRLEKRWRVGRDGAIAFVFEVQNATLRKETSTQGLDCQTEGMAGPRQSTGGANYSETTHCKVSTVGPLTIPSIGVEAFF